MGMKERFIGYHIDDSGSKSVPIATGRTRGEAQSIAIQRVLTSGVTYGQIAVQNRTEDVDEPTFIELTQHLNMCFMKQDAEARG